MEPAGTHVSPVTKQSAGEGSTVPAPGCQSGCLREGAGQVSRYSAKLEMLRAWGGNLLSGGSSAGSGARPKSRGGETESGPGQWRGWTKPIGRGTHCWNWEGLWLAGSGRSPLAYAGSLMVLAWAEAPRLGRGSTVRALRAIPPTLGHSCPDTPEHVGLWPGFLLPERCPARSASPRRSSYSRTPASRSLPQCWAEGVA